MDIVYPSALWLCYSHLCPSSAHKFWSPNIWKLFDPCNHFSYPSLYSVYCYCITFWDTETIRAHNTQDVATQKFYIPVECSDFFPVFILPNATQHFVVFFFLMLPVIWRTVKNKQTKHGLLLQSFNSQFQGQHHVDAVSDIFP